MNERKFDAGFLAEQIDSARRSLDALPEKLRDTARFQGQNHSFDTESDADSVVENGPDAQESQD
jgi:hypothetical protein